MMTFKQMEKHRRVYEKEKAASSAARGVTEERDSSKAGFESERNFAAMTAWEGKCNERDPV